VIEFTLLNRSRKVEKQNLSKKQQQYCAQMAALEGSMQPEVAAKVERLEQKWHDGHYRYEFDLGSDAPELVKMLWVVKDANDTRKSRQRLATRLLVGLERPNHLLGRFPTLPCHMVIAKMGIGGQLAMKVSGLVF
jgi:hypothetical protein